MTSSINVTLSISPVEGRHSTFDRALTLFTLTQKAQSEVSTHDISSISHSSDDYITEVTGQVWLHFSPLGFVVLAIFINADKKLTRLSLL